MSSRYGQLYAQQAYLAKLLQRAGYAAELPSFLSGPSATAADHALLAWMSHHLKDEEHWMSEADVAQALQAESLAMQRHVEERSASAAADALLLAFEEANDLLPVPDQQQPPSACEPSQTQDVWLEGPVLEALDLTLEQLAGERTLYRSQIQELQALETQLDAAQRAARISHAAGTAATEQLKHSIAAEHNAVSKLNAQVNTLLQDLQAALQDMTLLSQQHSSQWLMLVGSNSKELYLQQSSHMMELLASCNLQEQSSLESFASDPGSRQAPAPHDPDWLQFHDPFTHTADPGQPASDARPSTAERPARGLSAAEEQRLMRELRRLGEGARCAETSLLRARVEGAQHGAELGAMRALLAPRRPPGPDDAATRAQLEAELQVLAGDEARLLSSAVPSALEQVVRTHEAAVLHSHYELQGWVLEELVKRRAALVCTLLDHLVRHQLVAAVQSAEQRQMQGLYETVQSVEQLLGGVLQAANARCAVYMALSGAGGGTGTAAVAAAAAPSPGRSRELASVAVPPHQRSEEHALQDDAVERLELLVGRLLAADSGGAGFASGVGAGAGGEAGVSLQLQALRDAERSALASVSSKVYDEAELMVGRSRAAVQATHQLLVPPSQPAPAPGSGGSRELGRSSGEGDHVDGVATALSEPSDKGPGGKRIVLHPAPLAKALRELRVAACEMNELINSSVAEQAEAHRRLMENQEEGLAERSVLDWFYLQPSSLNAHVAGVEQRLAAMKM